MCLKSLSSGCQDLTRECINALNLQHSTKNEYDVLGPSITLALLPLLVYGTFRFSQTFPAVLWSKSTEYYVPASFQYDETETFFDNSIWTYGTDYLIAAFMAYGTLKCLLCDGGYLNANLRWIAAGLLAMYSISVIVGAFAHQFFTTLDSLNTVTFRILWTICVATVAIAGGFIGAIGSELGMKFDSYNMKTHFKVPILPMYFWVGWATALTIICIFGGLSYKRPACDIFIAGTTQTTPTAYSILVVWSRYWGQQRYNNRHHNEEHAQKDISSSSDVAEFNNGATKPQRTPSTGLSELVDIRIRWAKHLIREVKLSDRLIFYVALLLNAPLLPAYPILLDYKLNLGLVNTILHSNLFVAWGLQFYSLWCFCKILSGLDQNIVTCTKNPNGKVKTHIE
jgi:hypothetical protein